MLKYEGNNCFLIIQFPKSEQICIIILYMVTHVRFCGNTHAETFARKKDTSSEPTSVNSRLQVLGNTYLGGGGGKFDAFLMFFLYFGCFSGGGEFGIWRGESPQEIAGNNTENRHMWTNKFQAGKNNSLSLQDKISKFQSPVSICGFHGEFCSML